MGSQQTGGTHVILNAVAVAFSTDRQSVVSCPTANGSHRMAEGVGYYDGVSAFVVNRESNVAP